MNNPRGMKEQIAREEKELLRLQTKKSQLDQEIRELLLRTTLVESEEGKLHQLESQVRTIHEDMNTLRGRILQRKEMLPQLQIQEVEAEKRLQELKRQIIPLSKEVMDSDTEVMKSYNRAIEQQQRVDDLLQKLTEWVTEGQYLARRFGLSGVGLRVPGRPNFDNVWQRLRIGATFRATPPADFTDKLRTLDRAQNVRAKQERREEAQKQTAEFVEKHGGARVVQG